MAQDFYRPPVKVADYRPPQRVKTAGPVQLVLNFDSPQPLEEIFPEAHE